MVDFKKVDSALLERICSDAKIELSTDEKEKFMAEMSGILEAFGAVGEVDTEGVQPAYHPTNVENVWRDDLTDRSRRVDIRKNTAAIEKGYIVGPKLV